MKENRKLFDKVYGCLAGVAIGDAMGMPSSFLSPHQIRTQFGKIEDFRTPSPDHIYHAGLKAGQVTDDTEQTLAILQAILAGQGKLNPETVASLLLEWLENVGGLASSALGPSSRRAFERIRRGLPLAEAGRWGDTNGAAMRISPVGILHASDPEDIDSIVGDVALGCLPTHNTNLAISGAAAIACAIAACFQDPASVSRVSQAAIRGAEAGRGRGFEVIGPSLARRIELALELSQRGQDPVRASADIYDLIGAGVAIAESVPAALGLFALSRGEPQQAILLAANMGGDCDTVASMVGGICGAYSGAGDLPSEWLTFIEEVNGLDLAGQARALVQLLAAQTE